MFSFRTSSSAQYFLGFLQRESIYLKLITGANENYL
jgi:hypothetical protein